MKTCHKPFLTLGLLALLAPAPAQTRTYTAQQAVQDAVLQSDAVAVATAKVDGERAKADETLAQLFPSLTFTGGYARLDTEPYTTTTFDIAEMLPASLVDDPLLGQFFEDIEPTEVRIEFARRDNFQFQMQAQQVIFAGTGLHRQRAMAVAQLHSAREEERAMRHDVAFQAEELFWQLAMARQSLDVTGAAIVTVDSYVSLLETLLEVGLATESDLLTARVQQASLRVDALRAKQGAELAENAFRMIVHVPDGDSIDLDLERDTMPLDRTADEEQLTERARSSRPEARMLEHQMIAAKHGAGAAWATWLPSIALQGNIYLKNPDRALEPNFYWSGDISVGLQWQLWDQGLAISRNRQARAGQRQIAAYQRQLHDGVKLEVEQALGSFREADKLVLAAQEAQHLAQESLRLTELNFREGLARNVDVLEAQTALSKASLDVLMAEASYHIAEAGIRRAIGMDLGEQ